MEKSAVEACHVNPCPAKLIYLDFHPLEVVSRYRDPQPQVVENYSYLFNLRPNIYKSAGQGLIIHTLPLLQPSVKV